MESIQRRRGIRLDLRSCRSFMDTMEHICDGSEASDCQRALVASSAASSRGRRSKREVEGRGSSQRGVMVDGSRNLASVA
ncbi:hypothetical protein MAPG_06970 [Magnaporthiopsis poae ATCC 64411]|uniref:Uncharacterized protein n=1 Tax=Magnaporthiopsis poae (strain ATCC 64411 / 73-15) TaxID=644358 RepID=A0A0C4E3H1_MAGP6|nr:hypothetical protein MAPG_06970 [Magnaporthiopsis poae ATCC 64411]